MGPWMPELWYDAQELECVPHDSFFTLKFAIEGCLLELMTLRLSCHGVNHKKQARPGTSC